MFKKPRFDRICLQPWMIHAAGAAVCLGLAAGYYCWFYAPAGADIDFRSKRMDQLQILMTHSERIATEHRRLTERLVALQATATRTRQRIPRRPVTQEFVQKVSELADAHGLKVELCTAAALQEKPSHSQVEVTCRAQGGYASVCRFLAAVDQLPQVSRISTLEVSSTQESRSYPFHVVFQLYYRGELHDTEVKRGTL